jgi:hypothetical protein
MPDFGFRLPRFLRSHRSLRSHSSSTNPRNDAAASNSPNPSSTALSSHPSSTPRQAMDVTTATSHISPLSSVTTNRLGVDDCSGRSSQISRSVTPMNAAISNPTPQLSPRPPTHSPYLSNPSDPVQYQHPSRSLAMPSQESSVFERQRVSLLSVFIL